MTDDNITEENKDNMDINVSWDYCLISFKEYALSEEEKQST